MSIVGLIDDKFNISKLARLAFQVITLFIIILYLRNDTGNLASQFSNYGFGVLYTFNIWNSSYKFY